MKWTNEQLTEQAALAMRTHALLYYAVSKYLVENFEFLGGRAVRKWIRKQGNWRGVEMRKAHTALGMPVDMEHVQRFWDNALSDFWHTKVGKYTTYDVSMQVPACGYADVWQERDWWTWGHVYCDELHQSILKTYNPDAVVVIPECLMKGEHWCDFRWVMPPHAQLKFDDIAPDYPGQDHQKDYMAQTPEQAAFKNLRRGARLFGMELHMLKEVLQEDFPEQAEEAYGDILKLFARERAADMAKSLEREEDPLKALAEGKYDIPFTAFEPHITQDKDTMAVELKDCPIKEGFAYFNQAEELSDFCPCQLEQMSACEKLPVTMEAKACMCKGASVCKFYIHRRV